MDVDNTPPVEGEKRSKKRKACSTASGVEPEAAPEGTLAETASSEEKQHHHKKKKKARLENGIVDQNDSTNAASSDLNAGNVSVAETASAIVEDTPDAAASSGEQPAGSEDTGEQRARKKHRRRHRQTDDNCASASPAAESASQLASTACESEATPVVDNAASTPLAAESTQKKKKKHKHKHNQQQPEACGVDAGAGALVEAF